MSEASGLFAPVDIEREQRGDGTELLRSRLALGTYPETITDHLITWADRIPDQSFLAERDSAENWRKVTYGEAYRAVGALGTAFLSAGLGAERPLALLSGNSINHALVSLAAMHVGVPIVPVSQAYSLMSKDFGKLGHVFGRTRPGGIFVEEYGPFSAALDSVLTDDMILISADGADGADGAGGEVLAEVLATPVDAERIARAHKAVSGDSVAKILFTSGSTGSPKGVITTHRMLSSNQQSLARAWPFVERRPPVLVDWLPWSHAFGANHNFNLVLRNGGTFYIDEGKPAPGLIEKTVANLRDVSPTIYVNVPAGFEALLPFLEEDDGLAANFFARLDVIFYAAAALPRRTWDRLDAVAHRTLGRSVAMTSGWGATETGPLSTLVYFPLNEAGVIGVPVPGVDIKLAPVQDRLEIRVKGPNVMPGYFGDPEATARAFDEEGFYRTGDAVTLRDPEDPAAGIVFDGRIGESFKLKSGTWVNVGVLRPAFIGAMSPLFQDVVIAGENGDFLGVLAFPNIDACRALVGDSEGALSVKDVLAHARLRQAIAAHAAAFNADNPASSTRIRRILLQADPPGLDAGETTDKGYLNQRAILTRRHGAVAALFSDDPAVIEID